MNVLLFLLLVIIALLVSVVTANTSKPCPLSTDDWYAPQTQLCCINGVTDKFNEHDQELDCCDNSTYVLETQICCGKSVFDKIEENGKEIKCCGVFPYLPSDNRQICCKQILYDRNTGTSTEGCCGKLLINTQSHKCCSDGYGNKKPHKKEKNKKCCKTEYYSKETHHCFRGRYVLQRFHKICYNQTYDTRIQKCCDRKLYNVSENSQHYKCCGSSLHNDSEYKCCEGETNFPIPHNASCCKKNYYHKETHRCCDGVVVPFENDSEKCCGTRLYDSQYQGCCGRTPYNTSSSECCKPNGAIILKGTHYKCCGTLSYDSENEVCCMEGDDFLTGKLEVITKANEMFHDKCCATYNLTNKQSYSSRTHHCLSNGTIIPKEDLCGNQPYNGKVDLCCNGVLDKGGTESGRDCCGIKSYSINTQICCENMVLFRNNTKGCETKNINETPLSKLDPNQNYGICKYCFYDGKSITSLLKPTTITCKQKVLKIEVLSERISNNHVIMKGVIHRDLLRRLNYRKTDISIQLPCSCTLGSKRAILITDLEDHSKLLRLGDSDLLLPWTKKINQILRRKWGQCEKYTSKLALNYVSQIKSYVDFTASQLQSNEM